MKDGKVNEVGSHLQKAFRNSSLWNCRLRGDLVFPGFLQFPFPPASASSRNCALEAGNLSVCRPLGDLSIGMPPPSSL